MKYSFENINVGDEVYFDSTPQQFNRDLYWKVLGKLEEQQELIVGLDIMGCENERWTIHNSEVRYHLKPQH